jgi:anti-sigma factor RsiW
MSNHDSELKLQAYLDGELTPAEAAEVRERLAKDADGLALLEELRNTKLALAGNEATLTLPESREFFWSKVRREIERQDKPAVPAVVKVSWAAWMRHHLVSVGGAALLTCVLGLMLLHGAGGGPLAEVEAASDDMGAYTFRDQQEKMTFVWFYDKSDDSDTVEPAAIASMDPE